MIRLGTLIELSDYDPKNDALIKEEISFIENHLNKIKEKLSD